jgi:hypothetical protein
MVSLVGVVGLLIIVAVNSAVAALMTRFFRVRLSTTWGPVVYALLIVPVALLLLTLLFGAAGLGFDLGNQGAVIGITIVLPMVLGLAFDYVWMPAPDEVELPTEYQQDAPRR